MASTSTVGALCQLFEGTSSSSSYDTAPRCIGPGALELMVRSNENCDWDTSDDSTTSPRKTPEPFVATQGATVQVSPSLQELSTLVDQVALGNVEAKDLLIEKLKGMCDLLPRKIEENANLTTVLHELSHSRAEAIRTKVLTLESYHKLQGRVHGLQRASCLATAVSRASCGRATRLRGELGDARMELAKARKQVGALSARVAELRAENAELVARASLYERALGSAAAGGLGRVGDAWAAGADCRMTSVKPFPTAVGTY